MQVTPLLLVVILLGMATCLPITKEDYRARAAIGGEHLANSMAEVRDSSAAGSPAYSYFAPQRRPTRNDPFNVEDFRWRVRVMG